MKKWWQTRRGRWIMIVGATLLLITAVSYLVYNQMGGSLSAEQEQIVAKFYKVVWVDGNIQKAQNMLANQYRRNEFVLAVLEVNCDLAKDNPAPITPILMAEAPDYQRAHEKLFYVYHPKTSKTVLVFLTDSDGEWRVKGAKANDQYETSYVGLKQTVPELQWKEVPLP
jgi:hypothetical protein